MVSEIFHNIALEHFGFDKTKRMLPKHSFLYILGSSTLKFNTHVTLNSSKILMSTTAFDFQRS